MKRIIIRNGIAIVLGIMIFCWIGFLNNKIAYAASKFMMEEYNRYRMMSAIAFTLLGVLIESKALLRMIKEGVRINGVLLIAAMVLIVYPLVPYETALDTFGLASRIVSVKSFVALMYQIVGSRTAMSILGGIFLVRSLNREKKHIQESLE